MKTYLISLSFFALLSCNNKVENNNLAPEAPPPIHAQKSCNQGVAFGDIDVCIPTIKGYTNIYNNQHPEMIEVLESNEHPSIQIIAYYVNDNSYKDETYKTFDDSDYFKIYSVKSYRNKYSTSTDLVRLYNVQQEGFIKENWEYVSGIYDEIGRDVAIDRPVILDSYKTNENFLTVIFLMKYSLENDEKLILGAMNFLLIKNRIIHFAYYLKYNDENLKEIKQKNNYIGLKIIDENK